MPNSAWTETGSSINLTPTTTPIDTGASTSNPNCLTNADKVTLINQYSAELATKTQLDTTAASLSVSTTAYDSAVAAISTTLVNAGAPSTWATTWPDGTIFGPVLGIRTSLSNCWSTVATLRTALQGSISAAQAAASQIAATQASQLHQVSWASTALPSLPSSTYPAGYLALTTDKLTYQVSSNGNSWTQVQYAASGIYGQISVGQLVAGAAIADIARVGSLTAGYIYFADGFCLNTLEPSESGANVTSGHVLTAVAKLTNSVTIPTCHSSQVLTAITGLGWTVTAASTSDVFNINAVLCTSCPANTGTTWTQGLFLVVDGNTSSPVCTYPWWGLYPAGYQIIWPFVFSLTGLSAGTHTIQFYACLYNGATVYGTGETYALCQRIY